MTTSSSSASAPPPSDPTGAAVAVVGGALFLLAAMVGFSLLGRRQEPTPQPARTLSRIDALLASPPSREELAELARGPVVVIDVDVPQERRAAIEANVQAMLRAAMAIRFDAPVPVLGTETLWDYLRAHVRMIRVFREPDEGGADSVGNGGVILVPDRSVLGRPVWSDPDNGGAGVSQVTVLVHEARHLAAPELHHAGDERCQLCASIDVRRGTCPVGHGASVYDPSLKYGGAWAAHYWSLVWLADHSGSWLSDADREQMRSTGETMLGNVFCDRRPR